MKSLSHVRLFATPWTVAHQALPPRGFSRQEYCSGLPFPSPGDLPGPGIQPRSPALQADALTSEPPGKPKSFLILELGNIASESWVSPASCSANCFALAYYLSFSLKNILWLVVLIDFYHIKTSTMANFKLSKNQLSKFQKLWTTSSNTPPVIFFCLFFLALLVAYQWSMLCEIGRPLELIGDKRLR